MSADLTHLKVLLIDDEWFIRSTIRQMLVHMGIANVYEAGDPVAAMSEALRIQPNVILCDIHMPIDDGLSFVAKLRKAPVPAVAATPVIMLTSDSNENTVVAAKGLQIEGYLVKPVSTTAVKKALERALKITISEESIR